MDTRAPDLVWHETDEDKPSITTFCAAWIDPKKVSVNVRNKRFGSSGAKMESEYNLAFNRFHGYLRVYRWAYGAVSEQRFYRGMLRQTGDSVHDLVSKTLLTDQVGEPYRDGMVNMYPMMKYSDDAITSARMLPHRYLTALRADNPVEFTQRLIGKRATTQETIQAVMKTLTEWNISDINLLASLPRTMKPDQILIMLGGNDGWHPLPLYTLYKDPERVFNIVTNGWPVNESGRPVSAPAFWRGNLGKYHSLHQMIEDHNRSMRTMSEKMFSVSTSTNPTLYTWNSVVTV